MACGGAAGNSSQILVPETETPGDFPFATKEPVVYQAEIVATGDGFDKRWFVARDGDRWRIDFPENGEPSRTRLRLDVVYSINHRRKIYAVAETTGETVNGLTDRFFKGKEYRKFEKIGTENGVTKYRIANKNNQGEIVVSVNDAAGMMVREEFVPPAGSETPPFVYEIRNLKLSVDDGTFEIPALYRKVSLEEYQRLPQKKNE
jgi:hypothetical protein